MSRPETIILTHSETGESVTIAQLAENCNITRQSAYNRYTKYKKGEITEKDLFSGQKKRLGKRRRKDTQTRRSFQKTYVFRPDIIIDGEIVTWSAHDPNNLEEVILDSIVGTINAGWTWNCYPTIGIFATKNELVRHFVYLERHNMLDALD